jgi:hypothetical protein
MSVTQRHIGLFHFDKIVLVQGVIKKYDLSIFYIRFVVAIIQVCITLPSYRY